MGLDLSQAGRYLLRVVAAARRRKLRVDFLAGFLEAFFCLSFLVAAFFLLDRIRLEVWPGGSCLSPREWIFASLATAAAASVAFGLARAWWKTPSTLAAAKVIDDAFGLHDRVGTSIDVVEGRAAGRLGPMVVADTVRAVQALDVRRAYPFPAPGHRVFSALALGVTLWLAFLPIPSSEAAPGEDDPTYQLPEIAGPDADPYVRFDKLPDDPRAGRPKSWTPPKEKEHPPWDRPKPPKPDPPSALPSPEFTPQPNPKQGGGGGGGGQPPPPQPTNPPPPSGGGAGGQTPGGGGGDNPLFGEKERIPVNLLRKDVKPLLGGGRGKVREMEIDDGGGAPGEASAGGAPSPQDFKTLYQQYQRLSESALAPERVSPEDRELVKKYFKQIEPR